MHKSIAFQPTRALSSAWDLLMKAPLPLWVGGLILWVVQSLGSFGGGSGNIQVDGENPEEMIWLILPLMFIGFALSIVVMGVTAWLRVGYYNGVRTVMRDGDVEFDRLYKAEGRWLTVFLTLLLQGVLAFAAALPLALVVLIAVLLGQGLDVADGGMAALIGLAVLLYLPVFIYIQLGLILMVFPAALDGFGPVESLRESWSLAGGERMQLFLIGLLQFGLMLVGLLACCIGVIPAGILAEVMWCEAYVQATRDRDDGSWWIDHRGRKDDPGAGDDWDAGLGHARSAEAEPVARDAEPEPPASPEGFDPGGWRDGEDEPRA